jgi:fumarylpyruvate hydrolase
MSYAVDAPVLPTLPVVGREEVFPVRRIWCVGRNYADHAREMGSDPDKEPPFFFAKPADAIVPDGSAIPYPPRTANLHHEIELVVAIGGGGRDIPAGEALGHVFGYGVGVDLTRRDLQNAAKAIGRPWEMGKGFDRSAPCSALHPAAEVDPGKGAIWLKVNGAMRQSSDISEMIWDVAGVVAELSAYVELAPGDLIYTGTPEGVGPIRPGDAVEGAVEGVGTLRFTIAG